MRGAIDFRENLSSCASSPFLSATRMRIGSIAAMGPKPFTTAASAILGDAILSSLQSSHDVVTETDAYPSETVALKAGEELSVVCSRTVVGLVRFVVEFCDCSCVW